VRSEVVSQHGIYRFSERNSPELVNFPMIIPAIQLPVFGQTSPNFRNLRCCLFFLDKVMKKAKTTLNPLPQSLAGFKNSDSVVQGMNPFWDRQNTEGSNDTRKCGSAAALSSLHALR
jgi:hypothetical protein